jgi:hypothetical protein
MPHPHILRALGMTPRQWGDLPAYNTTRIDMTAQAIQIMNAPFNRLKSMLFYKWFKRELYVSRREIDVETMKLRSELIDELTHTGFKEAMIQQAQAFQERIESLQGRMAVSVAQLNAVIQNTDDLRQRIVLLEGKTNGKEN